MCEQSSAASVDSRAGFPWLFPSGIWRPETVYATGKWDKSSHSGQNSCKEGNKNCSVVLAGGIEGRSDTF